MFRSFNASAPGLYRIRSDGAGEAKRLTDGKVIAVPTSFSPDGKRLAIFQPGSGGNFDIFTVPVEAEAGSGEGGFRLGKAELFLGTPFLEVYPEFSPDGRWLAYASNESGTQELYVRPYPGPGGRWQVSTEGGRFPQWSKDGRELFFQGVDLRMMVVGHSAKDGSFVPGKPRVWTETRLLNASFGRNFDLAPDGRRLAAFVADDASGAEPPTHLTFFSKFFDEVRRRMPEGQ